MPCEQWKPIEGYEETYEVSSLGNVRNIRTGRLLKLLKHSKGYRRVHLHLNGCRTTYYVHRLVAYQFIPNVSNKPEVNHIDGQKTNNVVQNLEWVTMSENNALFSRCRAKSMKEKIRLANIFSLSEFLSEIPRDILLRKIRKQLTPKTRTV